MSNNITIGDISIDCKESVKLRDFYHILTGWESCAMYGCPALVADNGLVILFMGCDFDYIPPIWPEEIGKQQKQMHFNFQQAIYKLLWKKQSHLAQTKPIFNMVVSILSRCLIQRDIRFACVGNRHTYGMTQFF